MRVARAVRHACELAHPLLIRSKYALPNHVVELKTTSKSYLFIYYNNLWRQFLLSKLLNPLIFFFSYQIFNPNTTLEYIRNRFGLETIFLGLLLTLFFLIVISL